MEKEEKELESRIAAFDALRERIGNGSELIGRAWAEYKNALAANQARALKKKSHPAPAAAKAVKEKGHELAEAVRRARAAEWIVELYEWHLPWLTELGEMRESEAYVERDQEKDPDRDDPVSD